MEIFGFLKPKTMVVDNTKKKNVIKRPPIKLASLVKATKKMTPISELKSPFTKKLTPLTELKKINLKKNNINLKRVIDTIAYNESRGIPPEDKYTFSKYSGRKDLGYALGKYQVTEGELATYAKKYLGHLPTKSEFLESPEKQETYINNKVQDWINSNYKIEDILRMHRGGMNSAPGSYSGYVNDGIKYYNSLDSLNITEPKTTSGGLIKTAQASTGGLPHIDMAEYNAPAPATKPSFKIGGDIASQLVPFSTGGVAQTSPGVLTEYLTEEKLPVKLPIGQIGINLSPAIPGRETIKWAIETPEKVVKSIAQIPIIIKNKGGIPYKEPKKWNVSTYQEDQQEIVDAVIDGRAPLAYAALPFIQVPFDVLYVNSLVDVSLNLLQKGLRVPNKNWQADWEYLGRPKTLGEAKANMRTLQHTFHPDKMGMGSDEISKRINAAYSTLVKQGIPKVSPAQSIVSEAIGRLRGPASEAFKARSAGYVGKEPTPLIAGQLTERAGYQPKQPFQPYVKPAVGLSIRETGGVPVKVPITKELIDVSKKSLDNLPNLPEVIVRSSLTNQQQAILTNQGIAGEKISKTDFQKAMEEFSKKAPAELTKKPGELKPLVVEARKYKSAEEFVKAQGTPVYRGGLELNKEIRDTGWGIPVTTKKEVAIQFKKDVGGMSTGKKTTVGEYYVDKNAKIATKKDTPQELIDEYNKINPDGAANAPSFEDEASTELLFNWAKKNGFDGIDMSAISKTGLVEGEIKVFNNKVLKTKSQLTDIWNKAQATKATPKELEQGASKIFDAKTGIEYEDRFLNNNLVPGRKITEREYMQLEKGKTGEVVYMSPDEYLSKIAPKEPTQSSIDYMKKQLAKGEKLGMPSIDYTETTIGGKYPGQEGRNRAYLAKELGLKEIPVLEIRPYEATKGAETFAQRVKDLTIKNGGATIRLDGDIPTKGFSYSPFKDSETKIPIEKFVDEDIDNFIDKYYGRLTETPERHLGLWIDEGMVYIDVARVIQNEQTAVAEGLKNNQIALFDLATGETKRLKDYEKIGTTYVYKGENQGTVQGGGETAVKGQGPIAPEEGRIPGEKTTAQRVTPTQRGINELINPPAQKVTRPEDFLLRERLRNQKRAASNAITQYKRRERFLTGLVNSIQRELEKPKAQQRNVITFVKKLGEFNQTVVNEIKRELGIEKPISKMNLAELKDFINQLKARLKFKFERGYRPSAETRTELGLKGAPGKKPTDADYIANRQVKKTGASAKKKIGTAIEAAKKTTGKILAPISTRLGNIDPSLKYALRKFEWNSNQTTIKDSKEVLPFLKGLRKKKITTADSADLDLAFKNGDKDMIDAINKKYGTEEEYRNVGKMLDEMYARANEVGFDIGYKKNYWPRVIKDYEGLLNYINNNVELKGILDKAISQKEMDLGRVLNQDEKAYLINTMIRGYGGGNITLSKVGAMKNRVIDLITPELNQFYFDSQTAIIKYIQIMDDAIAARKFFGKGITAEGAHNIEESIGQYLTDLLVKGKITAAQELELRQILTARFAPRGTHGIVGLYKNLAYIDVMGSFYNAITQLGDLAPSIYRGGWGRTIKEGFKSLIGKPTISKEALGIERIAEEFTDNKLSGRIVEKVFKLTGLNKVDRLGKEALVNSSVSKYMKIAKKPTTKFLKMLDDIFGEEAPQVLTDLRGGVISENVKYLAFNELLDFQPVALSEMPEQYLRAGNGRIFYMLKSYTIKQWDAIRREAFDEMKRGNWVKGITNLLYLTGLLVLCNGTADEIKDFVLGRKTKFTDRVIDQIAMLAGFSRYSMGKISEVGLGSALVEQVIPPTNFIDNVSKDLMNLYKDWDKSANINKLKSVQDIPLIGKFYYWWFGKGRDNTSKANKTSSIDDIWNSAGTKQSLDDIWGGTTNNKTVEEAWK